VTNFDSRRITPSDFGSNARGPGCLAASHRCNNYGVTVLKSNHRPADARGISSPKGTLTVRFWPITLISSARSADPCPGVSNVFVFGAGQYAMRFWVKPDVLAKLTSPFLNRSTVQSQNSVNPPGRSGRTFREGQEFTYSIAHREPEFAREFGNIVVAPIPTGRSFGSRRRRVELGAQTYSLRGRYNGNSARILAIYQLLVPTLWIPHRA